MTKKEMLNEVVTIVANTDRSDRDELIEALNHEIELLEKRNASRKPTKVQRANEELKEEIKAVLSEAESPVTVSDLLSDERLSGYSSQKVSALLRQLVANDEVVRMEDKRKAYFSIG